VYKQILRHITNSKHFAACVLQQNTVQAYVICGVLLKPYFFVSAKTLLILLYRA